jgi:hypothetical protein
MTRVGVLSMKFAKTWLCVAIALWVVPLRFASALADSTVSLPKLDLHETRLENGLRVIVVLDHSGRNEASSKWREDGLWKCAITWRRLAT